MGDNPFEEQAGQVTFGGSKYITEEGEHDVQVGSITDGTFTSGAPFAEVVFQDTSGRTIRQRVWYDGDYRNGEGERTGLVKILRLYKATDTQPPQEGEFDPADRCRIQPAALKRLEGKVLSITVEKEPAYNDPEKMYAEVQWHNPYKGPALTFPAFKGHGGASSGSGGGGSKAASVPATSDQQVLAADADIPF